MTDMTKDTPSRPKTKTPTLPRLNDGRGTGWDSQVILWNDDVSYFREVIHALMEVFGHGVEMAAKITYEAHLKGRAIAQVESRKEAEAHAAALRSRRLRATVEDI